MRPEFNVNEGVWTETEEGRQDIKTESRKRMKSKEREREEERNG